ncbi:MAG: hypothetical protein LGR52_12745 [Candidatus Thiosymbion ectosymbiont of Robbea hypermnestra]|nr:hypothetical protein [Candidatus Thiosymbion ectosymbiont of Robbea hypermnestra]
MNACFLYREIREACPTQVIHQDGCTTPDVDDRLVTAQSASPDERQG